jgi:hypothetical protein
MVKIKSKQEKTTQEMPFNSPDVAIPRVSTERRLPADSKSEMNSLLT